MAIDTTASKAIDVESYVVTDEFFGSPYIDVDEWRDDPLRHRYLHGGFEGTDTRFSLYFPPKDQYGGRFIQPLEGGPGGHEHVFGGPAGSMIGGGVGVIGRLGAYMVESNQGHIGTTLDPRAGDDASIYSYRASAECARLSRHLAEQIYGEAPHHGYVYGGSGGARRSPLCLENTDVWDGAMPYMGGGEVDAPGTVRPVRSFEQLGFTLLFNAKRVLGSKVIDVIDATDPGGTGDPFAGLTTHQREELANLYRMGFPRGAEFMIEAHVAQMGLWTTVAETVAAQDPDYFDAFWTREGYVGHDSPEVLAHDVVDVTTTVSRVLSAKDVCELPEFAGPEFADIRSMARMFARFTGTYERPALVEIKGLGGYPLGSKVEILSGPAAGRKLYCSRQGGDLLLLGGGGEAGELGLSGVESGEHVHVDNRNFLAFCHFYRHHVLAYPEYDFMRVDGEPIFPQHETPFQPPYTGMPYSADFKGKMLWIHHTHDASLWPGRGVYYADAVRRVQGEAAAAERFRLRWTDNAEHIPPMMYPAIRRPVPSTRVIDYAPIIDQSLADLIEWVENDIEPAATAYRYEGGCLYLPESAADRGGIQPMVRVTANGGVKANVRSGETVSLEAEIEVPPGAGTIVAAEWDFDGSGAYPYAHDDVDGAAAKLQLSTSHTYDEPGTYFATVRVVSHRDGDVSATSCRIPNLARARIVVT